MMANEVTVSPVLEAAHITKRFGGVVANDDIDFTVKPGEIHVLLGENGAGKTTLMNILYGLERPDEGEIRVEGKPVHFDGPKDAIRQGVVMVHQHFMLVPVFTVLENIVLGVEQVQQPFRWLRNLGVLDRARPKRRIQDLADQLSLKVNLNARVGDLPVGIQQKVEIIKALYRGARILILDEPTAVLTPAESTELFGLLRLLAQQGLSVVMITHKLKEGLAIADRISVMRQGKMVGTVNPADATEALLAEMMVGRKVILQVQKPPLQAGEPVLQISGLQVLDDRQQIAVDGVDLTVRAGEILGIAGVQGNGQTELAEAIAGLRAIAKGRVEILGQERTQATPRELIEAGLAHVPEDRGKNGLVKPYSIADNIALCTYYKPPLAKGLLIREGAIARQATRLIEEFDIRPGNPRYAAGSLSGGNQQKVVMARELSRGAHLLVACQPTRGVDIGAIELIHNRIVEARSQGMGVLLISSELDEILTLSDRVAVMFQGKLVETLEIAQATRDRLGGLMAGVR
ncbi:ABC transporter ATP-binding protein [Oscillatoria sp. FACHB-1407]|uniref:ABC transporter ATP-binding protein n=1 Tax=Oscillatoria sp. FACHB-1407 TaxID=2692847 RepID=UPI001682C40B|nr:ABC transporter ATP-binding protein [Oscillatoria sp. FACHB-1407]MBD2460531.1 ABC transporter ATP-binding protein [Oscillatoria sp. FACHB-1407]